MGNMFIMISCIVYFLAIAIIPATSIATIITWFINTYTKQKFGESIF